MKMVFCTLFNSCYLDKGLVLYDSMEKHLDDFVLYIFAFDDVCYDILKKENLKNAVIVPLKDFETDDLLKVKKERTPSEYCWTCTPWTIKYVFDNYDVDNCTYIDADMMFFSSPRFIFEKMKEEKESTLIVPHRYRDDKQEKEEGEKTGYYCVEYNTFFKTKDGIDTLNWWAEQCLNWCHYVVPSVDRWYGDQKYLNVFQEKFDGVKVCDDIGVGLAPWNDMRVSLVGSKNGVYIEDKEIKEKVPLVIYHFSDVRYVNKKIVTVSSRMTDKELHTVVFDVYVKLIDEKRKYIEEKYDFAFSYKKVYHTKNVIIKIYQKYIMPIRHMKKLENIYFLKG